MKGKIKKLKVHASLRLAEDSAASFSDASAAHQSRTANLEKILSIMRAARERAELDRDAAAAQLDETRLEFMSSRSQATDAELKLKHIVAENSKMQHAAGVSTAEFRGCRLSLRTRRICTLNYTLRRSDGCCYSDQRQPRDALRI